MGPAWRFAGLAGLALSVTACTVPTQLGGFSGRDKNEVTNTAGAQLIPAVALDGDLAVAGAAAENMLQRENQTSARWENPETGARGTITPVASVYQQGGAECRDFLASYVREAWESWLHGEACRNGFGRWSVRDIKPWQRP